MLQLRAGAIMRTALIADLFMFVIGLMLFSILPVFGDLQSNKVEVFEVVFFILGVPALVGLFGRFFCKPRIPFNEWAYLYTAAYVALISLLFYSVVAPNPNYSVPTNVNIILFFIFVGQFLGAGGAHIIDGSKEPVADSIARKFEYGE